ncbi:ribbon-helix-helix domain-containing protein [Saccharolobus islandicus]|uniref:ribbon-helix-helix domain-containing protein n=1 Tax=Saccharolobus islandicus TaxID=43080 RepID=UPI0009B5AD78|nr:ribbon-helix-helix domain-containing protein [Sulfolobus islandicus]
MLITPNKKKRKPMVSFTISKSLLEKLDELSKKYGVSRGEIIRQAIIEKIEKLSGE